MEELNTTSHARRTRSSTVNDSPGLDHHHLKQEKASKTTSASVVSMAINAAPIENVKRGRGRPPSSQTENMPLYQQLTSRIRSYVRRLKHPLLFVEAYEAEGWRHASRDKLQPAHELQKAKDSIHRNKIAIIDTLRALEKTNANDQQLEMMIDGLVIADNVICSRCGTSETTVDNDILLCDSEGCNRAYHQKCQNPIVKTQSIPVGNALWYCETCNAVFESLKCINYALGTTYEQIDQVFPELLETEPKNEEEDSENDEDFKVDDEDNSEGSSISDDDIDGKEFVAGNTSSQEVDQEELKFLQPSDVISPNHRSMRSLKSNYPDSGDHKASPNKFIGQVVAKLGDNEKNMILGVIMEQLDDKSPLQWRAHFKDGTVECFVEHEVQNAINLGNQLLALNTDISQPSSRKTRKRSAVDYRKLNDLLFKNDRESEDEIYKDAEKTYSDSEVSQFSDSNTSDLENEMHQIDHMSTPTFSNSTKTGTNKNMEYHTVNKCNNEHENMKKDDAPKRSQRKRKTIDYLALHEGATYEP